MAVTGKNDLGDILLAVQKQVVDAGVFNLTTCFISRRKQIAQLIKFSPADQMAVIIPERQQFWRESIIGGFPDAIEMRGKLGIALLTRLILDDIPRDNYFFTKLELGIQSKMNSLLAALSEPFFPLDADGNYLLIQPMLPDGDIEEPSDYEGVGWGMLLMHWEIRYLQRTSCTFSTIS